MSRLKWAGDIYYFDVVAAAIGLAVFSGYLSDITLAQDSRGSEYTAALGFFFISFYALGILRTRAYTQDTAWLLTIFAAASFVAMIEVFWPWHLLTFSLAIILGSAMLVFALVVRTKTISEPLSQRDVFVLASLTTTVIFALAVMEAVIRLIPGLLFTPEMQQVMRSEPANYGVAHPYIGHLQTPNSAFTVSGRDFTAVHHVDAMGFRNKWPWPERAEIVIVGDSVVFGFTVADDETWPAVLARSLPDIRLVNLGLAGAGPQQYLRVYETFGVKLRPKLLLVGVWLTNDFADAETFDSWLKSGVGGNDMFFRDFGRPRRVSFDARHPVTSIEGLFDWKVYPQIRRSHLFNLMLAVRNSRERQWITPPRILSFADGSRLRLVPDDFGDTLALSHADRPEFRLLLDALTSLHALAARHGTRTLMILQPGKEEVYLPLLTGTTASPTTALCEAFDRLGIEYLDLAPVFRQRAAAGERLFREVDGHPNPEGYALIAQLVLSQIDQSRGQLVSSAYSAMDAR